MRLVFSVILIFFSFIIQADPIDMNGTWQGVIIPAGQKIKDGTLLYAEFKIANGKLTGSMRDEVYETDLYAVKLIEGEFKKENLSFKQIVVEKSKKSSSNKWCRLNGSLNYNPTSGYLTGKYTSSDCKRASGEIILYKSEFKFVNSENMTLSHIWFDQFVKDYEEGLSAPSIRELERKNFVFEPIYFDYDKYDIRPEHEAFLNRMIKVVKGHSDLRVLVTGHTDSDGSDQYNDMLSQKRAQAIISYFESHGLSKDRLEFDFKGEKSPVDTNDTPEGKQRNRRVDFKFI